MTFKNVLAYQMEPLPVTFSVLEGHFYCLKPFHLTHLGKYNRFTHELESTRGS